jgi:hypothetical protein
MWLPEDRDKALAYTRQMARVCKGCGTKEEDWERDKDAFVGDHRQCQGCLRLEEERGNAPDDAKGIHYFLTPRVVMEQRLAAEAEAAEARRRERAAQEEEGVN